MKTHLRHFAVALLAAIAKIATLSPQPASGQTQSPDSFIPGVDSQVSSVAIQADGKILVGGYFTTLGGQTRGCIAQFKTLNRHAQAVACCPDDNIRGNANLQP